MASGKKQFALVGEKDEDGRQPVLCIRDGDDGTPEYIEGHLSPLKDGEPILGDVVQLKHRKGSLFHEVETLHKGEQKVEWHKGPAKVNSNAYCEGWERIFGKGVLN